MDSRIDLNALTPEQLRQLSGELLGALADKNEQLQSQSQQIEQLSTKNEQLSTKNEQLSAKNTKLTVHNEKLTFELALLKRHQFGRRSEQSGGGQLRLLDEIVEEDMSAIEQELDALTASVDTPKSEKQQPKRQALPASLPRTEIHHDPDSTTCGCGCQMVHIGDDVSEKLDYDPGTFSVERHIRSKWACKSCETVVQAPVAPHIIDKGIPTTKLLTHVLISKYTDHQPLYRQNQIFQREGIDIPRSTLSEWVGRCGVELAPLVEALKAVVLSQSVLHADETPVKMLEPGNKKTKKAYVWAFATTRWSEVQAVVYDFQPTRAGEVARAFLEDWGGHLVCDDYGGYKASFKPKENTDNPTVIEVGCWAHSRRKFVELVEVQQSPIAAKAVEYINALYDIEREAKEFSTDERKAHREEKAKPIVEALYEWLVGQRDALTKGTRTARAIDYTLNRWDALIRYLENGNLPIDNNWVENQIRPWALGRSNWLFAGSLRSGQRAANIMTLIQSAKINGLNPQAYLQDVLEKLPTAKQSDLSALLPHNWKPADKV
jgi:transposase